MVWVAAVFGLVGVIVGGVLTAKLGNRRMRANKALEKALNPSAGSRRVESREW